MGRTYEKHDPVAFSRKRLLCIYFLCRLSIHISTRRSSSDRMAWSIRMAMQERRYPMKANGAFLTDQALGLIQTLQENDNSSIESIFEGIYEIEELVLNREADASNDERLVMMQTLRDIRHLLEELKIRKGYNY